MKRYLVTYANREPDVLHKPDGGISAAFDTREDAEAHIKTRSTSYSYQIWDGVCNYQPFVDFEKTPLFQNKA